MRAGTSGVCAMAAKSNIANAFRRGALYALGDQVVFSFGNMVVAAALSRHGTPADFGVYILTQRVMDVAIQLSNGFFWTPLTFAWPTLHREQRGPYQGSLVLFQVCFCVLLSGFMSLFARITAGSSHTTLHATFQPLVCTAGGILFREFTRRLYFAHMRLKEAFWTDTATVALQIAGVAWMQHSGRLGVSSALAVLSAGSVAVSLWWVLRDWATWRVSLGGSLADLRRDFQLGRWVFSGNLVALASAQCNPWVLNALLGSSAVSTYAVCESLVNIPRAGLTSMQNVLGPMVARAHHERGVEGVEQTVRSLNRVLLLLGAVFCVGLCSASPMVAHLIYRYAPSDTRLVTTVLALNLLAFVATLAQAYGLTSLRRAEFTLYANLLGLLVQGGVCVALTRLWHAAGAATALLAGSVAVLVFRHLLYRRALREKAHPEPDAPFQELKGEMA